MQPKLRSSKNGPSLDCMRHDEQVLVITMGILNNSIDVSLRSWWHLTPFESAHSSVRGALSTTVSTPLTKFVSSPVLFCSRVRV